MKGTETEPSRLGVPHHLKAGDTPALGLRVDPGSGGRRFRPETAEPQLTNPVDYHGRLGWIIALYPATPEWTRQMCKIAFADDAKPVVVGLDEVELLDDAGVMALADTGQLPSPVPRLVATLLIEERPLSADTAADRVTDQLQVVDDDREAFLEEEAALAEDDAPTELQPAVGTLPAALVVARAGVLRRLWWGLLDVLRVVGEFLAWPFRRDGGRDLAGWIVDQVADGVEAAADWERWHSRLIAKVIIGALSGLVLAGLGAAWLIKAGVFA